MVCACVAAGVAAAAARAVAVRRVDVRLRFEEEFDELEVAAGERVVERRAAAAVLPVVRVGAALHEQLRNVQPRLLVGGRVAGAPPQTTDIKSNSSNLLSFCCTKSLE